MVLSSRLILESSPSSRNECRAAPGAVDLWTKPTDLSHKPACMQLRHYIHRRHLLLLIPKTGKGADIHFCR